MLISVFDLHHHPVEPDRNQDTLVHTLGQGYCLILGLGGWCSLREGNYKGGERIFFREFHRKHFLDFNKVWFDDTIWKKLTDSNKLSNKFWWEHAATALSGQEVGLHTCCFHWNLTWYILSKATTRWLTYSMPCAVCRATSMRRIVSNLVSVTCRCRYRLLPSHHCVMIAKLGFVM